MDGYNLLVMQMLVLVGNLVVLASLIRLIVIIHRLDRHIQREVDVMEDHIDRIEKVYGINNDDL